MGGDVIHPPPFPHDFVLKVKKGEYDACHTFTSQTLQGLLMGVREDLKKSSKKYVGKIVKHKYFYFLQILTFDTCFI